MTLEEIKKFLEKEKEHCKRLKQQHRNNSLGGFYQGKEHGLKMALDNLELIESPPDENNLQS
jgi:hypothetical protein